MKFFLLLLVSLIPLFSAPIARADTVEELLKVADELAQMDLPYLWAGNDPAQGGLDCSGFMMYVFKKAWGIELPDESGKQLEYFYKHGKVWDGNTKKFNLSVLRPGDLVFITGTRASDRPSPITHVMMIVGPDRIVGSQDEGRREKYGTPGVGYFKQRLFRPYGIPSLGAEPYRKNATIYAYARLYPPKEKEKK